MRKVVLMILADVDRRDSCAVKLVVVELGPLIDKLLNTLHGRPFLLENTCLTHF